MKKKHIISLLLISIMILCSCRGGNAVASIARPAMDDKLAPANVSGTINVDMTEAGITVSGTTDLAEGAIAKISILSEEGEELISKTIEISGKEYSASFEYPKDYSGRIYGFLSCTPSSNGKQPRTVTDVYGKKFANMDGENVIWNRTECMFVLQSEITEI